MPRGFLSEGSGRRSSDDQEPVTVDVILKRDLELSWGVYDPARQGEMIWLPKSMCKMVGGKQPECAAKVTMPAWLATKKGLI